MLGYLMPHRSINTSSVSRSRWRMYKPFMMIGCAFVGAMISINASAFYGYANNYVEYKKKMWVCVGMYEFRDTIVKTKAEAESICERTINEFQPDITDDN